MTQAAKQFIGEATFNALTNRPVHSDMFAFKEHYLGEHIGLVRRAKLMVIAPATADFLAKAAHGHADDLLSTLMLTATCPVLLAPAMNVEMWSKKVVQRNISLIKEEPLFEFIDPGTGYLSCQVEGKGRMAEPGEILGVIEQKAESRRDMRILITAGPTREYLDDVRYISNASSGRMGYALVESALQAGHDVVLVSGPVDLPPPIGCEYHAVVTTSEMLATCEKLFPGCDGVIAAAAVCDYKPVMRIEGKNFQNGYAYTIGNDRNR